jgi:hypothetical protein
MPAERLQSAGEGFPAGRRVLGYADLRAARPRSDPRPPMYEITLRLTGNMEVGPIELKRGDRMRFVLINDTMMEHPIHLHELERDRRGNSRPISASSTRGDSGKRRVLRARRAKARATFVSSSASGYGSERA